LVRLRTASLCWDPAGMELSLRNEFTRCLMREEETLDCGTQMEDFLRDVEARAYRIARVTVRDADESLDIVQDAMIRLVRSYGSRPASEWKPLFYRILKNRIRDWHRRAVVRNRVVSFFGGNSAEDYDPVATAPAPQQDNPVEQLERDDAMEALADALRQLPARQREAFVLRNFEGLNVAETATAMDCSQGSVKTHHARAVGRLRKLLGEHW